MNNSLTKKNSIIPADKQNFGVYMTSDAVKTRINQVLGEERGIKFSASIIAAVNSNPTLKECDNPSILSAALLGETMKLSPAGTLSQFYIVPYNDNKNGRKVAQFQLGYKGYIQLAIRTGQYKRLNVMEIKKGELIKYDALEETIDVNLIDDEEAREKAETIGYYAFFELANGFRKTLYWSKSKMERHALRYSKGYAAKKGYTFWEKAFDEMAKKTMLRQLIGKWGAMSIEFQMAYTADMASIDAAGNYNYVDSVDVEPTPAAADPEPVKDEKPEYTANGQPITAEPSVTVSDDGNSILFG